MNLQEVCVFCLTIMLLYMQIRNVKDKYSLNKGCTLNTRIPGRYDVNPLEGYYMFICLASRYEDAFT